MTVNDTVNDIVKNEIMSLLKNNPRITITDIAKALNISRPTVTRKIKELKIDNYIYRIGSVHMTEKWCACSAPSVYL